MTLKPDPLAYPPRGMSRVIAARYVGVSVTKFDELVADGRMPAPVRVDGRVLWDRIKIDMAFGDLDEFEASSSTLVDLGGGRPETLTKAKQAPPNGRSGSSRYASTPVEKGPSGWVLPLSPGDAIDEWYRALGFDPLTMTAEDMVRLQGEAHVRWQAKVVASPLGKRERDALRQFASIEAGQHVHHSKIKGMGYNTAERLQARGFVEIHHFASDQSRLDGWVLTVEGKEAVEVVLAGREPRKPSLKSA